MKDFKNHIIIGLTTELLVSLLPMFFCQILNNSETEGSLTFIQSTAVIFKLFGIVFFVVEVIFVAWEAVYIKEMRKLEQEGFEKLSEH